MNASAGITEWQGTVAFAPMLAVFVGNGGVTPVHRTVAHKVIAGPKRLMVGGRYCDDEVPVVVPAGTEHAFDAKSRAVIIAYLDVRHYTKLDARDLAEKWTGIDLEHTSIDCIQEDIEGTTPRPLAARTHKAVAALREFPTIRQAANSIGLSEGRFTHMISEQLGAPPQRWRRWLRLRDAIDFLAAGQSVTTAAYDAGFSDSSHFSRTCVEALGIRPSALKTGRTEFNPSTEKCDLGRA